MKGINGFPSGGHIKEIFKKHCFVRPFFRQRCRIISRSRLHVENHPLEYCLRLSGTVNPHYGLTFQKGSEPNGFCMFLVELTIRLIGQYLSVSFGFPKKKKKILYLPSEISRQTQYTVKTVYSESFSTI